MTFRHTKLLSLFVNMTSQHKEQRTICPGFTAWCGKGFGPPVTKVDRYLLVAKMSGKRTVKELRCMREVLKKTNVGVKQHAIRACSQSQVAEPLEK